MTDATQANQFVAILAEIDDVSDVLEALQSDYERQGQTFICNGSHAGAGPNVSALPAKLVMPGDTWQLLEAVRGLAWVVRTLAAEANKGSGHD